MEWLLRLGLLAAGIAVVWRLLQPSYRFVVRIEGGRPRVARGRVTEAFLEDVREVCRDLGVTSGWVGGVARGRRVLLTFSRRLPPSCRQRLRNLWTMHG